MKARDAIEQLKGLDPSEEIILAWWNQNWMNEVLTDLDESPISEYEWNEIVRNLQDEAVLYEDMAYALQAQAIELQKEREEN